MYTQRSQTIIDTEKGRFPFDGVYGKPRWMETHWIYEADGDPMLLGKDMNFPFMITKAYVLFEKDINPKEIRRIQSKVRIWVNEREMSMLYTNPKETIDAIFPDMTKPSWL